MMIDRDLVKAKYIRNKTSGHPQTLMNCTFQSRGGHKIEKRFLRIDVPLLVYEGDVYYLYSQQTASAKSDKSDEKEVT